MKNQAARLLVLTSLCAIPAQAQSANKPPLRPWVTAGIGATSNTNSGSIADMNRKEGGPSVMIAGGLLFREKYFIGVQQTNWEGLSFEWGEGGSSKTGTVGVIFKDIPATPVLRMNAGTAMYRSGSNDPDFYRGTVIGTGLGLVAFPRWAFSPALSLDYSWWMNGRALRGPDSGLRVGSKQLSITLALIGH